MKDISDAIKELSEIEVPAGLHGKIMRRLLFLKFRTPFVVVVSLLLMNLAVSGVRMWQEWSDMEASALVSFLVSNLEFSARGILDFLVTVYDVTPVGWLTVFIMNLLLVIYVVQFPTKFAKHKTMTQKFVA